MFTRSSTTFQDRTWRERSGRMNKKRSQTLLFTQAGIMSHKLLLRSPAFALGIVSSSLVKIYKAASAVGQLALKPLRRIKQSGGLSSADDKTAAAAGPMTGRRLQHMLQAIFLMSALGYLDLRGVSKLMRICQSLHVALRQEDALWNCLLKYCLTSGYQLSGDHQPRYMAARQAAHHKILSRQWGVEMRSLRFCRGRDVISKSSWDDDEDEELEYAVPLVRHAEPLTTAPPSAPAPAETKTEATGAAAMVPTRTVVEVRDPLLQEILVLHSNILVQVTVAAAVSAAKKELDSLLKLVNTASPVLCPAGLGGGWWTAVRREALQPSETNKGNAGTVAEWNLMLYDLQACAGGGGGSGETGNSPAFWFVKRGLKPRVGCIVLSADRLCSEVCVVQGTHVQHMFERVRPLCAADDVALREGGG